MNNIGLYFYRTFFKNYFEHLKANEQESEKDFAKWLHDEYKLILDAGFDSGLMTYFQIPNNKEETKTFTLKTLYPGLVCGVGYEHELGFKNELKLGFLFDHTTGLPYLPGSSIKGVLRHYFSMPDYMLDLLVEMLKDLDENKGWYLEIKVPFKDILANLERVIEELEISLKPTALKKIDWEKLESAIFDGKDYLHKVEKLCVYSRDMFLDAFISNSDNKNRKILDDDYITSHQNVKHPELSPFTNPNPVRFLKVSSAVSFTFQFRLVDTQISSTLNFTKELKCELFKRILLDQGIGAKTNVGYGQFEKL